MPAAATSATPPSTVVIVGAGLGGLLTALLLAGDGHRVVVLERDADEPPDPDGAWDEWERRGVAQFRQLYYVLPRFRQVAERELPALTAALQKVALRHDPLAGVPGSEGGDDVVTLTARRPTVEAVVAHVAVAHPRIEIRRGVAVTGLARAATTASVPHVVGVRTGAGEVVGDLVIDATGRRSPLSTWLTAIGVPALPEVVEDSGFVYHSRHFRSADGTVPKLSAPLLRHFGSLSVLLLPAEGGTWGVGLITSSRDDDLRGLHRPDRWMATAQALGPVAPWVAAGEPITGVDVMTRLEDRRRTVCPDRRPSVTGVIPVADAWASTNPTLGRGTTLALLHAVALRDTLRSVGVADPYRLALAWHDVTEAELGPHYDAIVTADRHRLAEIDAAAAGVPYEGGDVAWRAYRMLEDVAHLDAELLHGWYRVAGLVSPGTEVFASSGFLRRLAQVARRRPAENNHPSRDELVVLATG